jgi:hypothetical protein
MRALTLGLPDDKHQRLRALAKSRGTTVNRRMDEMTTLMLAEFDAETHFRLRAMRGADNVERGLALLDKVATESINLHTTLKLMPAKFPLLLSFAQKP